MAKQTVIHHTMEYQSAIKRNKLFKHTQHGWISRTLCCGGKKKTSLTRSHTRWLHLYKILKITSLPRWRIGEWRPRVRGVGAGWPNGPHTGGAAGGRPARCSDHSGDEVAWECIEPVCSLGLMLHFHGAGWSRWGELGQRYTEPLCTAFVSFCVSLIISHQGFKKGSGALYGI